MRALKRKEIGEVTSAARKERVIPFPGRGDTERAAEVLADFVDEAREVLVRLEENLDRSRSLHPGEGVRREFLRFLADREDWVDLHDFPRISALDRTQTRSLAGRMAEDGQVELERNPTYPNMVSLRITSMGRETLRRMAVAEAMEYMRGSGGGARGIEGVARDALEALRRLGSLEPMR